MVKSYLSIQIITPEGIALKKEGLSAVNVLLDTDEPIGIRPGHAPLIAAIKPGIVKFRSPSQEGQFEVNSGILRIRNNLITFLTSNDSSDYSDDSLQSTEYEIDLLVESPISQAF